MDYPAPCTSIACGNPSEHVRSPPCHSWAATPVLGNVECKEVEVVEMVGDRSDDAPVSQLLEFANPS